VTLEGVYKKALDTGISLQKGPARKHGKRVVYRGLRDAPFLGRLRKGENIIYLRNFYEEFERYVKKAL
jgi:hypothetical protein